MDNVVIFDCRSIRNNAWEITYDVMAKSFDNMLPVFGRFNPKVVETEIDPQDVSHVCHDFVIDIDKKEIRCDITILRNTKGELMSNNLDNIVFKINGWILEHKKPENGIMMVEKFKLISIDAVTK